MEKSEGNNEVFRSGNKHLLLKKTLGKPLMSSSVGQLEVRYECPSCSENKGKYHLHVNMKKGVFHCFRCHFGGPISLIGMKARDFKMKKEELKEKLEYPRIPGFYKFPETNTTVFHLLTDYLAVRGISTGRAVELGMGYSGNTKLAGRLVIPIREGGAIVYYVARSLATDTTFVAKEIGPKNSDGFMKRSEVVYGLDEITPGMELVIVEGIFDAEHIRRCGYPSVAILGSNISDIQIGKILAKNPSKIILMFDGDEAGYACSRRTCLMIIRRWRGELKEVRLPEDTDPDNLGCEDIKRLIDES